MKVYSFAAYYTADNNRWSAEWHSFKFTKAIKREGFTKYAHVPVCGRDEYLDESTAHLAPQWFAEMVAGNWDWLATGHEYVLIPIPGRDSIIGTIDDKCTTLVKAIAARTHQIKAKVADVLRHKKVAYSARQSGGPRPPLVEVEANIVVTSAIPPGPIVLVDDNISTGTHFVAAARVIRSRTGRTPIMGIAASRTTHEHEENPFDVVEREVDLGPIDPFAGFPKDPA